MFLNDVEFNVSLIKIKLDFFPFKLHLISPSVTNTSRILNEIKFKVKFSAFETYIFLYRVKVWIGLVVNISQFSSVGLGSFVSMYLSFS